MIQGRSFHFFLWFVVSFLVRLSSQFFWGVGRGREGGFASVKTVEKKTFFNLVFFMDYYYSCFHGFLAHRLPYSPRLNFLGEGESGESSTGH